VTDQNAYAKIKQEFIDENEQFKGWQCEYCLYWMVDRTEVQVDHAIPRSRRPDLVCVKSNLRICCDPCNNDKGSRDEESYREYIKAKGIARVRMKKW